MTKIEWVKNPDNQTQGITVNSKTGCLNHTPEGLCLGGLFPCYAYKLAHGWLKQRYIENHTVICGDLLPNKDGVEELDKRFSNPFYPRFWPERLDQIKKIKKPTGIFLDDMSDWMAEYWPKGWTMAELQMMRDNPQHRIYTLTKQPQNLLQFSPFPDNAWVGVTATDTSMAWIASQYLSQIEAKVKFLSLEPLLSWETSTPYTTENIVAGLNGSLDWLIIGACTGTLEDIKRVNYEHKDTDGLMPMPWGKRWTLQPRIEWLQQIVEAADKAGILVFLKDNLRPLFAHTVTIEDKWVWAKDLGYGGLQRQEFPARQC